MRLGRLLRWRHASFRRRRLPYVRDVLGIEYRARTYAIRHPRLWWAYRQRGKLLVAGFAYIDA